MDNLLAPTLTDLTTSVCYCVAIASPTFTPKLPDALVEQQRNIISDHHRYFKLSKKGKARMFLFISFVPNILVWDASIATPCKLSKALTYDYGPNQLVLLDIKVQVSKKA